MGAEASVVKSYELGIPYEGQRSQDGQRKHEPAPYEVYPAIHKEDGSKVSIFIYNKAVEPKIGPSCAEVSGFIATSLKSNRKQTVNNYETLSVYRCAIHSGKIHNIIWSPPKMAPRKLSFCFFNELC